MAFKFVVFSCLLALAHASVAPLAAAPVLAAPVAARLEEFDPLPQYRFGYDVADSLTGDYKSQTEQRDGDLVQGQYSVVEPDGTRRIVDYAADSVNGFNAVVRKEPLVAAAPAVVAEPAVVPARFAAAPVASPVIAAPPVARYAAAPVVAAPPVARYAAAPAVAAPISSFFARYAAAPVAAEYTGPVAAAYTASYPSPFARLAAPSALYPRFSPIVRANIAAYSQYAAAAPVVV